MSLPKINAPTFELTVPSTKQKVTCRPFLIKEEKILLLAMETIKSNDKEETSAKTIFNAIKTIINNCVLSDINVNTFAQFDIEYIFLKLRSKSVGEISDIKYINALCTHDDLKDEDQQCILPMKINLNEIEVTIPENHSKKILLTDTIRSCNEISDSRYVH